MGGENKLTEYAGGEVGGGGGLLLMDLFYRNPSSLKGGEQGQAPELVRDLVSGPFFFQFLRQGFSV